MRFELSVKSLRLDNPRVSGPIKSDGWVGTNEWVARGEWPFPVNATSPMSESGRRLIEDVRETVPDAPAVVWSEPYEATAGSPHWRLYDAANDKYASAVLVHAVERIANPSELTWRYVRVGTAHGSFALLDGEELVGLVAPRLQDAGDIQRPGATDEEVSR